MVGLALTGLGALVGAPGAAASAFGRQANGTVVDSVGPNRDSTLGRDELALVVEFTTDEGRTLRIRRKVSTEEVRPAALGERVPVVYLPRSPEKAELQAPGSQWITGSLMALMGVMTVVAALRPSQD
jgi:uncharacterized protein DUF3592